MRLITLLLALLSTQVSAQLNWRVLATDSENDGFFTDRPDAKTLEYFYDDSTDSIWLKLEVYGQLKLNNWGMNLMIDYDQDQSTGSKWPGQNNQFSFDRIATVWVTGMPGNYTGTVGISSAQQMMAGNPTGLYQDNIALKLDTAGNAYLLGMKREELDPDDIQFDLIASIGISGEVNDDIPSSGNVSVSRWPLSVSNKIQRDGSVIQYQQSNHQLNINGASTPSSYYVYDDLGRLLMKGRIESPSTTVSLQSEFKGVLLVMLVRQNVLASRKFWVH